MKLSIIIPVHNEAKFVTETLKRVYQVSLNVDKEVIVIDDGSTDGTGEILADLHGKYNFTLVRHTTNLGKGMAFRTGFNIATGDFVIIQDADLEYHPKDIPKLLERIDDDNSVAVYGDRGQSKWPKFGYHYVLGARFLTIVFNILYGQKIKDLYTCYKLFRPNDIIKMNLQSTGFEFEAEVSCQFVRNGGKILEVPIDYFPRDKNQGKHIGLKDAFWGLFTIIKYRFSH